jgi:hypothetical protein
MTQFNEPRWRIKRGHADLQWRGFELQVDIQHPAKGISLQHPALKQTQWLLAAPQVLVFPRESFDAYHQGTNLIVPYPCTEKRIFGGELSWRARPYPFLDANDGDSEGLSCVTEVDGNLSQVGSLPETLTVELVYSTQTNLLDTHPQMEVTSVLTGESIEYFTAGIDGLHGCRASDPFVACLIRRASVSTLLTVMPSDLESCHVAIRTGESGEQVFEFTWKLTVDLLEKGVIRRFRAFSATGTEMNALLAAASAFYCSEIPLTA